MSDGAEQQGSTHQVANPYLDMDPDDINHVHSIDYNEMHDLMNALPPGWRRLDPREVGPGSPPYVHDPTGETSWRNPNLSKIMAVVEGAQENERVQGKRKDGSSAASGADGRRHRVKKLRLMLQAGAPLGAVEQKARLEGVDMSLVLSPSSDEVADEDDGRAVVSDGEEQGDEGGISAIPETLVRKYKRMLKAGVPLDRVQQLAGIEAGASPEEVVAAVAQERSGEKKKAAERSEDPRMAKFVRMQKAGIPLLAIQNAARLQGHDMSELNEALGVTDGVSESVGAGKKAPDPVQQVASVKAEKVGRSSAGPPASSSPGESPHFTVLDGKVSFPTSGDQSKHPLTNLVRKMAQTVQKTSRFHVGSSGGEMIVDGPTLFHALGAFEGVRFARDEYNSTVGASRGMSDELLRSKRHGYAEIAASIGVALSSDNDVEVDIEGLDDLVEHIKAANRASLQSSESLLADGYYEFDSLSALYPPGSYVVAKHAGGGGIDCLCQVVWHRYTQGKTISGKPMKYFQLCCRFIAPVGSGKSTFAEVVEGIEMFEGRRSLSASASGAGLAFVPVGGEEREGLFRRYELRGELYNRITPARGEVNGGKTSHCYMEYEKGSFFQKRGGGSFNSGKSSLVLAAPGRIVVDLDAALENGHSISVGRDDLIDGIRMKVKEYNLHLRSIDNTHRGAPSTNKPSDDEGSRGMILFHQLPQEYLALIWPTTIGFSLTSKSWGDVAIDGLSDIVFDPTVFDRLVLPSSRKRMIKALVKHSSIGFHDLVQGKGEGTCFLLHGQPGTGKTLTAEAIAESLHCPLYSISMGTLGTTADELERRLSEILELSARWNALVLLDEADSFLEARSTNSPLERNAMVSVMLRLVEYHRGILFLTSNRIESLDPAFQTRITLSLKYEPLDLEGRAKVWENLLLKSGQTLDSLDLVMLAKPVLNGREIKNALRLAMALAVDEGCELSQDLLLETVEVVNSQTKGEGGKVDKRSGWLSFLWA